MTVKKSIVAAEKMPTIGPNNSPEIFTRINSKVTRKPG